MIRSMTGFGKGSVNSPFGRISVEMKALNHKSLNVACNPFEGFFLLEQSIEKVFEGKIHRGKIFVNVSMEDAAAGKAAREININENLASEYIKKIKKAQHKLGVKGEIEINQLINLPGVVETVSAKRDEKDTDRWPYIKKALEKSLGELIIFRQVEGKHLAEDFKMRIKKIAKNIREIKKHEKKSVAEHRKKLVQSIRNIASNIEVDKGRLETEVATFARNCDIAEERTRLEGHIRAYMEAIKSSESDIGKKLDFIAQEMQREANTIGAKSSDYSISKAVIEVKSEIDKIREQIRNIE